MVRKIAHRFLLFICLSLSALFIMPKSTTSKIAGVSTTSIPNLITPLTDTSTVFAALPEGKRNIIASVKTSDARAEILKQYLAKYESPLEPHAGLIVRLSDYYDYDYRWLVAIAQQESNLCKRIPEDSHNCWGWGIYPEPSNPSVLKVTRFDSYEEALYRIAPQFKDIFIGDDHHRDPFEVMKTYTPPSQGSWARGVKQFFQELQ